MRASACINTLTAYAYRLRGFSRCLSKLPDSMGDIGSTRRTAGGVALEALARMLAGCQRQRRHCCSGTAQVRNKPVVSWHAPTATASGESESTRAALRDATPITTADYARTSAYRTLQHANTRICIITPRPVIGRHTCTHLNRTSTHTHSLNSIRQQTHFMSCGCARRN